MLMIYGDIAAIKDPQWYLLELRSERTLGPTLKRLGKHVLNTFEDKPVEIFIPVQRRDHENFELLSDCYIFIHSDAFAQVRGLRSVVGVATLLSDDTTRKMIKVDDAYVRGIIAESKAKFMENMTTIQKGSFVRLLDGENRDYCGTILELDHNRAQVKIVLKGRVLLVETPVGNLINLDHVPLDRRIYYYCDVVDNYIDDYSDHALSELQRDLAEESVIFRNTDVLANLIPKTTKKHRSRYETATALIRRLIAGGEKDMIKLALTTLDAIQSDEIKKPKTAHIIYSIIKRNMVDVVYRNSAKIKTFRDVLRIHKGNFSLAMIEAEAVKRGIVFEGGTDED
jgi:transcription antitermination factor NusG